MEEATHHTTGTGEQNDGWTGKRKQGRTLGPIPLSAPLPVSQSSLVGPTLLSALSSLTLITLLFKHQLLGRRLRQPCA